MDRIWRVARYEFLHHVMRKRFLWILISLPLMILAFGGVSALAAVVQFDRTPAGVVDLSGRLDPTLTAGDGAFSIYEVPLQIFESEESARQALNAGELQAYFVIPQDYFETGGVRAVVERRLNDNVESSLDDYLRANLAASLPEDVAERVTKGMRLEVETVGSNQVPVAQQVGQVIVPLLVGILFVVVINTSGGYLLQAVVEEKANRTMEIVITSVSPTQLMVGKIIGNLSVGLLQMVIWFGIPWIGFLLVQAALPEILGFSLNGSFILVTLLILPPAFVLVAALMATVGATATEPKEAQSVAGFLTLPLVMPYWFMTPLMRSPDSPLAVAFTLFPLTAPVTLPMRLAFGSVPLWQTVGSISLLTLSAAGALWLAGRIFRLGMLRYGKALTLKEVLREALTPQRSAR